MLRLKAVRGKIRPHISMAKNSQPEQFSLRWNNFSSNLTSGFLSHLTENDLVDVTLAVEGQLIRAHKLVLSVCSPYFKNIFKENPCQHPVIILKDIRYAEVEALLKFMYQGEINIRQEELPTFLKVAQTLQVKGLAAEETEPPNSTENIDGQFSIYPDDHNAHQTHLNTKSKAGKDVDMIDRRKRSRDITKKNAKKKKQDESLWDCIHDTSDKEANDSLKQEVLLLSNEESNNSIEQDEDGDTTGIKGNDSDQKDQSSGSSNAQIFTENSTQSVKKQGSERPLSHVRCVKTLVDQLRGDSRQSRDRASTSTSSFDEIRFAGKLHVLLTGVKKDCKVCSRRDKPGERHQTTYYCDTCPGKPRMHLGDCYIKYHTKQQYKA